MLVYPQSVNLYLASSPDHIRSFLIINLCQTDVYVVTVVLLHSAMLHIVINEVHMEPRDRCERG